MHRSSVTDHRKPLNWPGSLTHIPNLLAECPHQLATQSLHRSLVEVISWVGASRDIDRGLITSFEGEDYLGCITFVPPIGGVACFPPLLVQSAYRWVNQPSTPSICSRSDDLALLGSGSPQLETSPAMMEGHRSDPSRFFEFSFPLLPRSAINGVSWNEWLTGISPKYFSAGVTFRGSSRRRMEWLCPVRHRPSSEYPRLRTGELIHFSPDGTARF